MKTDVLQGAGPTSSQNQRLGTSQNVLLGCQLQAVMHPSVFSRKPGQGPCGQRLVQDQGRSSWRARTWIWGLSGGQPGASGEGSTQQLPGTYERGLRLEGEQSCSRDTPSRLGLRLPAAGPCPRI